METLVSMLPAVSLAAGALVGAGLAKAAIFLGEARRQATRRLASAAPSSAAVQTVGVAGDKDFRDLCKAFPSLVWVTSGDAT